MAHIKRRRCAGNDIRYDVRWRVGGREHERSFRRARDAEAFAARSNTTRSPACITTPSRGEIRFGEARRGG